MSKTAERSEEIVRKEEQLIKIAKARGFKRGVSFISASGTIKGKVAGNLFMKWVVNEDGEEDELSPDYRYNGDLVSGGYGCIYSAEDDVWAPII